MPSRKIETEGIDPQFVAIALFATVLNRPKSKPSMKIQNKSRIRKYIINTYGNRRLARNPLKTNSVLAPIRPIKATT
jgi:hypothetical protein